MKDSTRALTWSACCMILYAISIFIVFPPIESYPPYHEFSPWPTAFVFCAGFIFWVYCVRLYQKSWQIKPRSMWDIIRLAVSTIALSIYLGGLLMTLIGIVIQWKIY